MKALFLPGIGASERDFPEYRRIFDNIEIIRYSGCITLKEHIKQIDQYVEPLEEEGTPYVLIGHSLGANLVYYYITHRQLSYLSQYIMVGGGPRFYPLKSWNTIFSLPRWGIALVLLFIIMGAPFLFLVYGWHGMYQRVNVVDLFLREGIDNIKSIYNQTLIPLLYDPKTDQSDVPALLIRLPNDLLFPQVAMNEAKELIPQLDEIQIQRSLIHFSHHLDILVVGHINQWLEEYEPSYEQELPFDVRYALAHPQSISVDIEQFSLPRWPFIVMLILVSLYVIPIFVPTWQGSHLIITTTNNFLHILGIRLLSPLLIISILILVSTTLSVYYWIINPSLPHTKQLNLSKFPKVSIIVPMRNEERNIGACLQSLLNLDYPDFEIVISDGNSSDDSVLVAKKTVDKYNSMNIPVQILNENELPNNWVGKSWGCWNAVQQANGDYYLFTDADTVHHQGALRETILVMHEKQLNGISIVGKLDTESWWERAILPFFKSLLFIIFGGRFNYKFSRILGIGQYILIEAETYHEVGGHQAIKDKIAEDIHLAANIADNGKYRAYNGNSLYSVRMYQSFQEIKMGLERNAFESVGSSYLLVILASLGLVIWRLLPIGLYPLLLQFDLSPILNLVLFGYFLFTVGLFFVDTKINQDPWYYAFLFPFGIFALIYFLISGSRNQNQPKIWKDRSYDFK